LDIKKKVAGRWVTIHVKDPVEKAEKNPRELRCGACGNIVKVGRYICKEDEYTCGKCKKEDKNNAVNDKGTGEETSGAVHERKEEGSGSKDNN